MSPLVPFEYWGILFGDFNQYYSLVSCNDLSVAWSFLGRNNTISVLLGLIPGACLHTTPNTPFCVNVDLRRPMDGLVLPLYSSYLDLNLSSTCFSWGRELTCKIAFN